MENRNRKPENFNWVQARADCSLRQMFERLKLDIEQDIGVVKDLGLPARVGFTVGETGKIMKVYETDGIKSVAFLLAANSIKVNIGDTNKLIFEATVSLNEEGDCTLIVDGKECDLWQIRRRALEHVLFT